VETVGGPVRIKVSSRDDRTVNAVPEFDDCLRVATATGRPVKAVLAEAAGAWAALGRGPGGKDAAKTGLEDGIE
jgi:pyridinium-3,5-bisthiocarboxylic acid mononucleotide nickel chelatase